MYVVKKILGIITFFSILVLFPFPLLAGGSVLAGQDLSLWWCLPFVGMLGSLALMPLFAGHIWENHYGKIAFAWTLMSILSLWFIYGSEAAGIAVLTTFFNHYVPFIIILGVLYTISGGIHIDVQAHSTPLVNTTLIAIGTFLAGWIGTTGASMLLIRPLIYINRQRHYRVHHMVFFIFLVSNIGGALTPLGDPPLFLGFLNGISFSWPLQYLSLEVLFVSVPLLLIFYAIDQFFVIKEGHKFYHVWPKIKLQGIFNGFFFLSVVALVLMSGVWKSDIHFIFCTVSFQLQDIVRDVGLIAIAVLSWFLTDKSIHKANRFSWEPFKEIVKIFFGIFMTVIPVLAILDAGMDGALAPLIALVSKDGVPQNAMYFWLTGGLSAFLDNAPTYLVFFHVAGGNPETLMGTLNNTLQAISLGAVFLGAMTYIGNAPNFMVKAIAESHKILMPSFFGYMAWSLGILLPLFCLMSLFFF